MFFFDLETHLREVEICEGSTGRTLTTVATTAGLEHLLPLKHQILVVVVNQPSTMTQATMSRCSTLVLAGGFRITDIDSFFSCVTISSDVPPRAESRHQI